MRDAEDEGVIVYCYAGMTVAGRLKVLPKMRRPLLLHMRLLHPMEVPTTRRKTNMNPYHEHHIVRIRRRVTRSRYLNKAVYKCSRYELTIPSKYKDLAEAFMNKDLTVEAKQEGNSLIIEAKPVERPA